MDVLAPVAAKSRLYIEAGTRLGKYGPCRRLIAHSVTLIGGRKPGAGSDALCLARGHLSILEAIFQPGLKLLVLAHGASLVAFARHARPRHTLASRVVLEHLQDERVAQLIDAEALRMHACGPHGCLLLLRGKDIGVDAIHERQE